MSASGGTKAILAAFSANLGIAIAKLIAWAFSGSTAMLAEGIHSIADSGNQVLLLLGGKQAKKAADATHPFGYGRERYVYAFVVAIILFSAGGVFSVYEGIGKLVSPHPIETWWLPVVILVLSIGLESFSLRTAMRESRPQKGDGSWLQYIRRAKAPELPVVLLEDVAALTGLTFALIGVVLAVVTGNGIWDGIGTIAIGALLVTVAIVLGVETKSLLVGEGASPSDAAAIAAAILSGGEAHRIIHMKTLYLGPDELLVAAKLALPAWSKLADVAGAIDTIEVRVREAVPAARVIYLEPDVYSDPSEPHPRTDSIVIRGLE